MERIIFFDGVCNVCNASVQFILKRDPEGAFKYCTLQSARGQKTLEENGMPTGTFDTFLLSENGKLYTKSTAALRAVKELSGFWPMLYVFIIVPAFVRDTIYGFVARNRYKWFGKKESCMIPTPEIRSRFLE